MKKNVRKDYNKNFMSYKLKTAVLFLVFNRLDPVRDVFSEIKKAKPPRLYIASDGPREFKITERATVESVREYILSQIDWKCEVKTLFREKNLGCKIAVSSAIDWFFNHEEMGIILEDDCLPNQSFFRYCERLLDLYRDDCRVGQISGFNSLRNVYRSDFDYFFSQYGSIWGWATWRRAWKYYNLKIESWPYIKEKKIHENFMMSWLEKNLRSFLFDRLYRGEINTWDYQWTYAKNINSMLSIVPSKNLIINIGFGSDATHTTSSMPEYLKDLKRQDLLIEKINPFIVREIGYDRIYHKRYIINKSQICNFISEKIKFLIKS